MAIGTPFDQFTQGGNYYNTGAVLNIPTTGSNTGLPREGNNPPQPLSADLSNLLRNLPISTPFDTYANRGMPFDINRDVSNGLAQPTGGFFSNVLGGLGDFFGSQTGGNLLNTGALVGLNEYQRNQLQKIGRETQRSAQGIGEAAAAGSRFVPFTVTGTTGGQAITTPEGGASLTLSPQEQALQNQLFGGASQFYGQAQQPIAQTEQDIYNRMLELAAPQRERDRLMTEERLAAQGRLGTSSAAYGGATPEQLALANAQQEQLNQLGLQARGQALAEQQQAADLGSGMFTQAYLPQAQQLNLLNAGTQTAGLADIGRRFGTNLQTEAGLTGLEVLLQSELGATNLTSNYINALTSLIAQQQAAQAAANKGAGTTNLLGDLVSKGLGGLGGLFDNLLGD
jgi:hypothetical protein